LLGKEDEVNGIDGNESSDGIKGVHERNGANGFLDTTSLAPTPVPSASHYTLDDERHQERWKLDLWDVDLGPKTQDIARGLFSALRELDRKDVDVIFVEGINDQEGEVAAAIMNRLRKAAEVKVE